MLQQTKKKIVKITGGIFLGLFVLLALVLTGLQMYVNNNNASFVKLVNEKLNEAIDGDVSVSDVDINVWRHFPNIDVRVHNIDIKDSLYKQSVIRLKYLSTRINVLKLISKEVDIHNLYLENGIIHFVTDKNGYQNNYFLKKKGGDKKKKSNGTFFDEVAMKNIQLITEDAIKKKWIGVRVNDLHANIDYNDSIATIDLEEDVLIRGLGFNLEKGYFLRGKTVKADWRIRFNTSTKQLSFDDTPVAIGPTQFHIKGDFLIADTLTSHFKLLVKADEIDYREAASLVSTNIQSKINLVRLSRPLALSAALEGPMAFRTIPLVNVQWVVKDNQLVTPVLTLDECNFTGSYTNERNKEYPRTDDNAEVVLKDLTAQWGGISLQANNNTIVTNLVHPVLQFDVSSTTTLAALDEKLGLTTLHFQSGGALLNLQYNGPLGVDPAMLQYLSGNLVIKDAQVKYTPRDLTFSNCNGEVIFSQTDLLVRNLQCDLNTNHFKVDVAGDNLNVLVANSIPGKASLLCSVFTPDLDLNDFKVLFQSRQQAAARKPSKGGAAKPAVQIDDVLQNGTLNMNLKANAVHMNKFKATNVEALLGFTNNDIDIAKVSLQHADGRLNIKANIHQVNNNYHEATTNLLLDNINVQKLFFAFDDFGMQSLRSRNLKGVLDMKGNLKVGIDSKGNLLTKTMLGNMHFSLKKAELNDFKPLTDIQKIAFKNRGLDNIEFAELKDSLEFKRGDVYVHRMEIESSAITAFVEGIYSFGNNTDLSIQVPLSNFKKRSDDYEVKNKGAKRKGGASIYLRAKDDGNGGVKVGLDLFNKFRDNDYKERFYDKPSQ